MMPEGRGRSRRDLLLDGATSPLGSAADALEQAFEKIASFPASGSPRYAHELDLPALRSWPLPDHPYLVFNVECTECVDVWRVLHAHRDTPSWLREDVRP